jgi:peptidoglycan hydrolase CwlO-like protein
LLKELGQLTVKNMNIVVNEESEQKQIEEALKQFDETQKEKEKIYQNNCNLNKQIEQDKKEIKQSKYLFYFRRI